MKADRHRNLLIKFHCSRTSSWVSNFNSRAKNFSKTRFFSIFSITNRSIQLKLRSYVPQASNQQLEKSLTEIYSPGGAQERFNVLSFKRFQRPTGASNEKVVHRENVALYQEHLSVEFHEPVISSSGSNFKRQNSRASKLSLELNNKCGLKSATMFFGAN